MGEREGQTRRLFMTVSEAAVLYALLGYAIVLIPWISVSFGGALIIFVTAFLAPDILAACWVFHRLKTTRSRSEAHRAAISFAISAPVVLGVSNVLGELVGGYAEVYLGSHFILPSIFLSVILLLTLIPSVVISWVLHPSGGVDLSAETNKNEHR